MARPALRSQPPQDDVPSIGAIFRVVTERLQLKARGIDGGWTLFEVQTPAGDGPAPHAHGWEETHYILEGELEFQIGARMVRATVGMAVQIPANAPHAYIARSPNGARFLTLVSPSGVERMFAELERETPPERPDFEKFIRIAKQHGLLISAGDAT